MMKRKILAGVLAIMFFMPTHGQFLKKLQEKAEQPLKTEAKATFVFSESHDAISLDVLMNDQLKESGLLRGMEQVNPSEIPEFYVFEWKYTFEIKTKDGERRMNLLFKKDAPYFGIQISEAEKRFLVMDPKKKINVLFTGLGDAKIASATKILESEHKVIDSGKKLGDFSFNKIGDKSIMGYESEGFQAENNEFVYTFYIAKETGIGIHDFHRNSQKLMPANFNPNWLEKGMLLQMISEGKKSVRDNITITCIGIEKYPLQLRKHENLSLVKN
ncbi:hypothetical protein [Gillisia limnaea]|uniref:Secreted protein n=1 Tax=Gillisia limnaea (strain DSM 15749 / LMG 21470 / R-8282) TaxID=865937 RepID=H2BVZ7_GILLR|nr:hypothetical protein [Gillisia limnaea]EHQ02914.1 secreted protein [Gillisia limnaea DSM 15749]